MSKPITWQNVNSPDSRLAAQLLNGTQEGITGGFDKLGQVIANREVVNQGVADRARGAAEQEFMNQLYGFKSPAELQAARESGALAQQLASLDPRNQAAARTALDTRLATLQEQTTANNNFAVEQVAAPGKLLTATANAANVPTQIALDRAALDQKVALQPINDKAGIQDALNKARATNFTGERAPVLEALTRQEDTQKGNQLTVDEATTAQVRQDQILAGELARRTQAELDQKLAGRMKLSPIAQKMGLPLDATGAPDWNRMTTEQRLRLDDAAIRAGVSDRSAASLYSGDTASANKILADLRKTPGISAEAISRNLEKIRGSADSTRLAAPVGDDALAIATQRAQADVLQKERDSRNRFAPGSADALTAYEQLATEIPTLVPDDAKEDVPELQKMLSRFATQGIEVEKGRFVTPSAQDIRAAVRGYVPGMWGNFKNKTQAEDIEKQLKKDLANSDVTNLLQSAEESRMYNRQRAVRDILNPPPPEPKKR